jgi:hypothetical protein
MYSYSLNDPMPSEQPDADFPGRNEPDRSPGFPSPEPSQPIPQPEDPALPRYTVPRPTESYLYMAMNF